jgi:hypothetical protein
MGRNLSARAVFCGLVIFLSGKQSFAQEMVPIQKYVDQIGSERNPDAANFLFLRCTTILLLVGSLLQKTEIKACMQREKSTGNLVNTFSRP